MTTRIELSFGNGCTTAVLNLRTGELERYTGAKEFHARYGGRHYYQSRSRLSGAGWIPARPWIKVVSSYRTDTAIANMFVRDVWKMSVLTGRVKVIVPYDYKARDFRADSYPAVVIKNGETYLVDEQDVVGLLSGDLPEGEFRVFDFEVIRTPDAEPEHHQFRAFVARGVRNCSRVVQAMHHDELEWTDSSYDRTTYWSSQRLFWSRLGFRMFGGRLYKVVGGICRAVFDINDLDTVEALQAVAPANVVVLSPFLYLQESGDRFDAVATFEIDGEFTDDQAIVEAEEGIRCMHGHFQKLQERMEESARRQAVWIKQQNAGIFPSQDGSNVVS